jgi:hypothetical protein
VSEQNSRESRRQRLEQARQAEQRRKRRIRVAAIGGGAVIVAAAIAVGLTLGVSGGSSATPPGYEPLSTLGALQPAPFYWLHTHAADGIVHIESPVQRTYTLGQFFNEWGQPLGPDAVGPVHGHVTVLVNGKVLTGNPQDVPLTSHAEIQLEVGTPLVAPESISWANTGL